MRELLVELPRGVRCVVVGPSTDELNSRIVPVLAGAVTMLNESSPESKRGFSSGFASAANYAGTTIATVTFALLGLLPDDVLQGWAWRMKYLTDRWYAACWSEELGETILHRPILGLGGGARLHLPEHGLRRGDQRAGPGRGRRELRPWGGETGRGSLAGRGMRGWAVCRGSSIGFVRDGRSIAGC